MVHAWVSDEYINFALMCTTDNILPVIPIKHLVNHDSEPTTPHKLATTTKPSLSNTCVLLCPCFVQKETAHVDTKALNICHQSKKGFRGIFVGIPQHQKWYLVYLTSTRKIDYLHDVVFDEFFSSALVYTSRPYS